MYYFGQTQNVEKRWEYNGIHYKETSLYPYIEQYGWNNIQHIVLFREQTRENALFIENFLIETAREDGVCINKKRSGNISKEEGYKQDYYEQNKQQMREQHKQYYEENKDKMKQYREENKDMRRNYDKQYYEQNKEKKREYNRQHYQKNKDEINERRRQRYQKNREKELEQSRQRYQKKKLEQQLKEVETTLF